MGEGGSCNSYLVSHSCGKQNFPLAECGQTKFLFLIFRLLFSACCLVKCGIIFVVQLMLIETQKMVKWYVTDKSLFSYLVQGYSLFSNKNLVPT